jgi:hypothetical protein
MKPKSTTLIEKFGFKDTDLTSPKHDEIIIWLMNQSNLAKVLFQLNIEKATISTPICDYVIDSNRCTHGKAHYAGYCIPIQYTDGMDNLNFCPIEKEYREMLTWPKIILNEELFKSLICKVEAEFPISNSYNNFLLGFIDLKVILTNTFPLGKFNVKINGLGLQDKDISNHINYYLEIKTNITSFGETLRQINTYRKYKPGEYVLITPKTPFKEAFEQNGIKVYELN